MAARRKRSRRGARPAYRLLILLLGMGFALSAIGVRLVQLQVVRASAYEDLGSKQRVRRIDLPARRGGIYDRNGVPLAVSVEARAVYANPNFVVDAGATAAALSKILPVDSATLRAKLSRRGGFVYLARQVDLALARRALDLKLPGIGALTETKRVYPQGTLAGQIIGFVGLDNKGLGGMESAFDDALSGTPGQEIIEQDPQGRPIAGGVNSVRRARRGGDIILTLDRDVQFQAERALEEAVQRSGAKDGTALVMDAQTNEILAMANYPPFDPSKFAESSPDVRRNRAVQDAYEPGSVNKLVTAAAALENGIRRPSDMLRIPSTIRVANSTFEEFEPHPIWNISYGEALARSSNVGTIQVALDLGPKKMYDMMQRFGYGSKTGVEFKGESPGISLPLKRWSGTSIATIPIGQGIAVTPLQMVNVYTTIARDGIWMTPRLLREVAGAKALPRNASKRVVSTFTAAQLRAMLLHVVEGGTGRSARIPGYLIGGKTGTAYKPYLDRAGYSNDLITTFIGMVPVDRPRYVVGVAIDTPRNARTAAQTSAPAFKRIVSFVLARYGEPPQVVPSGADARKALRPALAPVVEPSPGAAPKPAASPAAAKPSSSPHPATKPSPRASQTSARSARFVGVIATDSARNLPSGASSA